MIENNTHIVAPVNVSDVRQVLNVAVKTFSALHQHTAINKYSPRKPIAHPQTFGPLTDAQIYESDSGFVVNSYTTPKALLSALKAGTAWKYTPPTGFRGNTVRPAQPWRLGDFADYEHACRQWMNGDGTIELTATANKYTFSFGAEVITPIHVLNWRNNASYRECYPCVCVFDAECDLVAYKTSDKKLGEVDSAVTIAIGTDVRLPVGTNKDYTYMKCVCTTKATTATAIFTGDTRFRGVPMDDAPFGDMKFSATTKIYIHLVGVRHSVIAEGDDSLFMSAAPYTGVIEDGSAPMYFGVSNNGQLALMFEIENSTDTPYTLPARITTTIYSTPAGATAQTFSAGVWMVRANGTLHATNSVDRVTVGAGQTARFALDLGTAMAWAPGTMSPQTLTANDTAEVTIQLRNEMAILPMATILRVSGTN